jgi:DNA polymerase III subunit epsilon
MTEAAGAAPRARRSSLRTRVLASFLGFALMPFATAVFALVLLVRERAPDAGFPSPAVAREAGLILLLVGLLAAAAAWRMGNRFLSPILRLRRGAEIVSRINLGHRIDVSTGDELEELALEFNRMAESLEGAYRDLGSKVQETTADLQEERNRLATVLRTMAEGVIVTNDAGEVLLMNPRARVVLGSAPASGIGARLGRLLPAARVDFHLKRLRAAWGEGRDRLEQVVMPLSGGALLRGILSSVAGPGGERAGFLFVFRDVSADLEEEEKARSAVAQLPELIKGPVANLHSLAEVVESRPQMPDGKRQKFLEAMRQEAGRLTERLRVAEEAGVAAGSSRWPLFLADPRELAEEAAASVEGVFSRLELPAEPLPPVLVEPFSWVSCLATVLRWAAENSSGWAPVEVRLSIEEESVVTSFRLSAPAPDSTTLEDLRVAPEGEEGLPLGEAVRRNRGELWCLTSNGVFEARLALLSASARPSRSSEGGIVDQQPEFYDFDLFLPRASAEAGERLQTDLATLDCVVFDTETTGLNPLQGDEIVSLSAVRIRRGKLLTADNFHALVNPGRPIPPESSKFHGIVDEAVRGSPALSEVLPKFGEYVGDAVLVGHNVAFDKKFLELAAAKYRLPSLENPILDTLFLSYGLHGDFEGHHLDAVAERLGVPVVGRHTSQGDSRMTAEIFLRLVPLLASRGIRTLREAQTFCDRMLLLRWQVSRF